MLDRFTSGALLFVALALPLVGCTTSQVDTLQVAPATVTMSAGSTAQLTAKGIYNHGTGPSTTQDLTNQVTWSTTSADVATVSAAGVVTGVGAGTVTITASIHGYTGLLSASSTVTVTANNTGGGGTGSEVVSVSITPGAQSVALGGQTGQFIAIGTTSGGNQVNLTDSATWTSSNVAVATVSSHGLATAIGSGTTTITALATNSDSTVASGTATFTVTGTTTEPLVSVAILPGTQTLAAAGQQANLTAIATTGSGTTVNLTDKTALVGSATIQPAVWASSAPTVAAVDPNTGIVTAYSSGVAVITAIASNPDKTVVTATATITSTATSTTPGTIASIAVIPGNQAVASPNDTTQFLAIGTTTTGATENITNLVTWGSSSKEIATIVPASGYATAVGKGTATITALYSPANGNAVAGTATFDVTGGTTETYVSPLTILPASQTIGSGGKTQFIALATLGSTGEVVDVTDSQQLTWGVADSSIATVSNYPANPAGVVTGQSAGTTTVTAELSNGTGGGVVTSTASITVTTQTPPEEILTLTIYPSTITVLDFNMTGQFLAIGTFSQPPYVRDLTNASTTTWISSEPELFPVTESSQGSGGNNGASAGLVTSIGSGGADIIAESTSKDGTIQVAQATFNCPEVLPNGLSSTPSCYPGELPPTSLLTTLTIFNEGLNTTSWEVTAPSATGTPDVIHCGPGWALNGGGGGSVCTATYPVTETTPAGTPGVVLEAQGGQFGGWSYNCIPSDSQGNYLTGTLYTAAGPNYCVATLDYTYTDSNGNQETIPGVDSTIGAIFNNDTLTVTLAGTGAADGVVTSGASIDCGGGAGKCSADFTPGDTVTLTETANGGATFAGWTGCSTTTATTCTITANPNVAVTATFNAPNN